MNEEIQKLIARLIVIQGRVERLRDLQVRVDLDVCDVSIAIRRLDTTLVSMIRDAELRALKLL